MKRALIALVVLGSLTGLGMLIGKRVNAVTEARAELARNAPRDVRAVTAVPVARRTFVERATFGGVVEPNRAVAVFPRLSGTLQTVDVAVGEPIEAGATIATLDHADLDWQVKQAEAQRLAAAAAIRQAKVQLDTAEIEQQRTRRLYAGKAIPRTDLDRAEAAVSAAKAAVSVARAQHKVATVAEGMTEHNRAYATITSPIAGVISKVDAHAGDHVTPVSQVVEIIDTTELIVAVPVPSGRIGRLHLKQEVTVTADALQGRTFTGHITAISPSLDPRSRHGRVEVTVAEPREGLVPNMLAEVHIELSKRPDVPAVPEASIIQRGAERVLFVVREGRAVEVPLEAAGEADGGFVPVSFGKLQASDQVIVQGAGSVRDGGEVTVIEGEAG